MKHEPATTIPLLSTPLSEFMRWLSEMPASFRLEPEGLPGGRVRVRAVIADAVELLTNARLPEATLDAFSAADKSKLERNRLKWLLTTAHLFAHPALRAATIDPSALERFLVQEIAALAAIAQVEGLDSDEERREELVRRTVRALGRKLPNESDAEADDRFKQVDSIGRHRLLKDAALRERRAREVREAMARKAAEEAAAKVSRE